MTSSAEKQSSRPGGSAPGRWRLNDTSDQLIDKGIFLEGAAADCFNVLAGAWRFDAESEAVRRRWAESLLSPWQSEARRAGRGQARRAVEYAAVQGYVGSSAEETEEQFGEILWPSGDISPAGQRGYLKARESMLLAHARGAQTRAAAVIAASLKASLARGDLEPGETLYDVDDLVRSAARASEVDAETVVDVLIGEVAKAGLLIDPCALRGARREAQEVVEERDDYAWAGNDNGEPSPPKSPYHAALDAAPGLLRGLPDETGLSSLLSASFDLSTDEADEIAGVTICDETTIRDEVARRETREQRAEERRYATTTNANVLGAPSPQQTPFIPSLDIRPRLKSVDFDPSIETVPPSWLVKGIITRTGLALLYGESASGKTFLGIHLALCVAWGLPFFGRHVKQGGVVYVAAEGGTSVLVRFKAAEAKLRSSIVAANLTRRAQSLPPLERAPIKVVTEAPDLSRTGAPAKLVATVEHKIGEIEGTGHRLALVVGDTWHAMLAGAEENSAADTALALRPLRELSERHGFTAILLHHPGKDLDRGARGSNSLPAAMDSIIELRVPGFEGQKAKSGATRRVTVVKVRDGEAGGTFSYRLPVVEVGTDEDGDPWTTCVVEQVSEPKVDLDGSSATDRELMATFMKVSVGGKAAFSVLREAFYAGRPKAAAEALRKAFRRAIEAAVKAGRLVLDSDEQWVSLP